MLLICVLPKSGATAFGMQRQVALIGFGEAASTFAKAGAWEANARAFDIDQHQKHFMKDAKVAICNDAATALSGTFAILSLVTADQALTAATEYGRLLQPGAIWCDMNSVAPETKRAAAQKIEAEGAHYVDAAIIAPVKPAELSVPILLSGPKAGKAAEMLCGLHFDNVRMVGDEIGRASAIKMIRSVMVKGIEALTDEMMEAANAAGVSAEVLASLDASDNGHSWHDRVSYSLDRMTKHGLRRAAEMEESASTLESLGVDAVMTRGTIKRQREAAQHYLSAKTTK